jgi:hypothetical protein
VILAAKVYPTAEGQSVTWGASGTTDGEICLIMLDTLTEAPEGTPQELQGADFFTIFTPPVDFTGEFTVSAVLDSNDECSDSTELLVHAVPEDRKSVDGELIHPSFGAPYGRRYKYTFESSGGSLDGVVISEKVHFLNDPFIFNWSDIPYGESTWSLDEDGKMTDWDYYTDPYSHPWLNINRFHPSPPGDGTPVPFESVQTYGWKCPLCSAFHDNFTHTIYTGFISYDESAIVPQYFTCVTDELTSPEENEEDYLGDPYLDIDDIVVTPSFTIAADGSSTFQIAWSGGYIKSDDPLARDPDWVWEGVTDLGCSCANPSDNPATVTVGTQTGTLTVWITVGGMSLNDSTYQTHSVDIQLIAP